MDDPSVTDSEQDGGGTDEEQQVEISNEWDDGSNDGNVSSEWTEDARPDSSIANASSVANISSIASQLDSDRSLSQASIGTVNRSVISELSFGMEFLGEDEFVNSPPLSAYDNTNSNSEYEFSVNDDDTRHSSPRNSSPPLIQPDNPPDYSFFPAQLSANENFSTDTFEHFIQSVMSPRDILALFRRPNVNGDPTNTPAAGFTSAPTISYSNVPLFGFSNAPIVGFTNAPAVVTDTIPVVAQNQSLSRVRDETCEPPAKCAKIDLDQTANDGQMCPICFEPWTSSGDHRLASLSCGHLFGGSCITKWLIPRPNRYCPTCKSQSSIKDIRYIYATSISYVDNSESETLRAELEISNLENARKESELRKLRLNHTQHLDKIKYLEQHISKLGKLRKNSNWSFSMLKNLEITKTGECRVFAYNKHSDSLFISQMIDNNLFPGYGLRQLDCETLKLEKVTYLHSKEIRAVSYSDSNKLLMSVALDKQIRISNNTGIESVGIMTEQRLWSCCWDREHSSRLYVGGASGIIMHYDMRQTRSFLSKIQVTGDLSTVMSVECIPGGIVTCQLQSLRVHTKDTSEFKSQKLNLNGSFTNLNYDPVTDHLLVSTRPSNQIPYSKYIVCTVNGLAKEEKQCNIVHTFQVASTQATISKSCQFSINDDHVFSMYNEADAAVNIWSISKQTKARSLPSLDAIVDTCAWSNNSGMFLGTLSKNKVQIYKLTN